MKLREDELPKVMKLANDLARRALGRPNLEGCLPTDKSLTRIYVVLILGVSHA